MRRFCSESGIPTRASQGPGFEHPGNNLHVVFEKSGDYARGVRRWKIAVEPNKKREITYEIIVMFDKEISIRGLR